ncbi:MAG: hypothetical protein LBR17_09300, partial [Bacteroidales bacterium]|nr:hypothetical protein [Bacteroidales bacterium]
MKKTFLIITTFSLCMVAFTGKTMAQTFDYMGADANTLSYTVLSYAPAVQCNGKAASQTTLSSGLIIPDSVQNA